MALRRIASAFGKLGAAAAIAAVFAVGLLATVYLSIRSPEIQVPEVVNKSYTEGEATLEKAGLDIRERAQRYKPDVQPGIILDQSPRAGETIKAGQTIAVVVSRGPKEGEQPPPPAEDSDGAKNDNAKDENAKTNENSGADSNKNENANRERPRNTNRNSNRNSNAATNLNGNANNRNAAANNARNANPNANRGANSNRALNTNANANRPRTTTNTNTRNANAAGPRNTSPARPAANANRRP